MGRFEDMITAAKARGDQAMAVANEVPKECRQDTILTLMVYADGVLHTGFEEIMKMANAHNGAIPADHLREAFDLLQLANQASTAMLHIAVDLAMKTFPAPHAAHAEKIRDHLMTLFEQGIRTEQNRADPKGGDS